MKVNYILSDTTKKATSVALSKVISKAEQDLFGDFIVIVPETKSIIIEKELLKLSKTKAFANVYVYSFVRLLKRLGFVSEEKIVTKPACVLLIRKIILSNIDKLSCYKKTAKNIGFAEKMYETIAQLKSSGVLPSDLQDLDKIKSESLKAKLVDIAFIYSEYEKTLGEGVYDDLDKLALLSEFAKSSEFLKNAEVFVVGFDNVTFEMNKVLLEIAKNAKETTFSCVYFNEKRSDKHIQSNDLYNKLKHIGDSLKLPYSPEFHKTEHKGDFFAIANYLMSTENYQVKSSGNIEVFEALSKKQELDFVANTILCEIKKGKRFKDIGVFVSDLSNAKLIKACFDSYGIPYFINEDHDVSSHFYITFLMNAFEMISQRFSSSKVLEFVSSPFFDAKGFADYQNYVNEFGVNYKDFFDKPKEDFESDSQRQNVLEIFDKLSKFVTQIMQKLKNAKVFADYVQLIQFVADFFDAKNKLESLSKKQAEFGFIVESEISLQMFEKVKKFAQLSSNFLGDTEVTLDEFILLFKSGFASVKVNVSPVSIDSVIIQSNTDGFFDIKDLFVVGAEEGRFPAKLQDTGVILDSEIEETKIITKQPVEPTVKEINKREMFRAYETLLEPKERLFVSYSLKDLSGNSQKPARIVNNVVRLFGKQIVFKNYERFGFVSAQNEEIRFAKNINKYINGEGLTLAELNNQYSLIFDNLSPKFSSFLNEFGLDKSEFLIESASDIYFKNDKTSISQLEKYFACPYLFFADYGLRLKENKKAKISSLDVGNVIHRVAELFMLRLKKIENLEKLEILSKVDEIFDEVLIEQKIKKTRNNAVLKLLLEESKRLCLYILFEQNNSSFKVKNLELNFKGTSAVKLELQSGKVINIEGKIDRVDSFGDYVRIIDYKTGDIKSDLKSVFLGEKIQLISYLSAICAHWSQKVAGVFYLPIHSEYEKDEKKLKDKYKMQGFILNDTDIVKNMDHNLSFDKPESLMVPIKLKTNKTLINENRFEMQSQPKTLDDKEFENIRIYVEKLCSQAVDEILQGFIEPSPLEKNGRGLGRCEYCNYAGFCGLENSRFAEGRLFKNKINKTDFMKED